MFEEELELENESKTLSFKSSFLYIFLILLLVIAGVFYAIFRSEKDLTPDDAKAVLSATLNARAPVFVRFRVGALKGSVDVKTRDPHYRLLEKLGYVKLSPGKDNAMTVALTPLGEETFPKLPEFKKSSQADGSEAFDVPLAKRELVSVKSVTTTSPGNAKVTYEWTWVPNQIGQQFDAESDAVQKFNAWDRQTLIKSYGVDFYKQNKIETVSMTRSKGTWKIVEE